jgi:hypothetical protein
MPTTLLEAVFVVFILGASLVFVALAYFIYRIANDEF